MAKPDDTGDAPRRKGGKPLLLLGVILALAGGGGGFYAVYSGLLFGSESHGGAAATDGHAASDKAHEEATALSDVAFVPVDPLVISLGENGRHLRFRAQLEVASAHTAEIRQIMPRVVDVLNTYLRAVDIADLRGGASLSRLRAQMLRRIQIVTGTDRVNDLLVMEFVLN